MKHCFRIVLLLFVILSSSSSLLAEKAKVVVLENDGARKSYLGVGEESSLELQKKISDKCRWEVVKAGGKNVYLKNKATGKYLIAPKSDDAEPKMVLGKKSDKKECKWKILKPKSFTNISNAANPKLFMHAKDKKTMVIAKWAGPKSKWKLRKK